MIRRTPHNHEQQSRHSNTERREFINSKERCEKQVFTLVVCAFAADRRGNFAGKTGKTAEKECELYEDTGLAEDDAAGLPREGSLHGVPGGLRLPLPLLS